MQEAYPHANDPDLLPEIKALTEKVAHRGHEGGLHLPTLESMPRFLREAGEKIEAISGTWNPVEIYTADPESIEREREIFLAQYNAGDVYHPQFTYSVVKTMELGASAEQLRALDRELRDLALPKDDRFERLARVMLLAKIDDDLATCELIDGIKNKDEALIERAMRLKYQGSDPVLLGKAQEDYARRTQSIDRPFVELPTGMLSLEERAWLETTKFKAEEIKAAFEWGLRKLGILRSPGSTTIGFQVLIDQRASSIDVRDKSMQGPTVFIPTTREVTGMYLLVLLVHEMGAHARQSMNGHKLFGLGGGALKFDDETLYEGLAMRNEVAFYKKLCGESPDDFLSPYVLAVNAAERGESFHGVFQQQLAMRLHVALTIAPTEPLPNVSVIDPTIYTEAQGSAWRTTYRVMRGHVDTSNPHKFAMSKDLAYFRGAKLDEQLVENGLGYMNEAAIMNRGGLQAMAELHFEPKDLPIQNIDLGELYWHEVLKPHYEQRESSGQV